MLICDKKLVILYGSQTGNSQDLAERIWRKAKSLKIDSQVGSFDKIDLNLLIENNIILLCVCSTTGQGDVPDNMKVYYGILH
jgi:sulfite reductase alpha subunit-like flavoprotein